jgi:CheY-like chemotaxis protein
MNERVLVVEDNAFNLEMLSDWLALQDYEVMSASTLSDAIAMIEKSPPHIVLLDVQLGADDGLSLAAWLREHRILRNTPVIAVTAHAMVTEQERMLQAGCNACISKPVEFQLLQEQLRKWLLIGDLMEPTDDPSVALPGEPSLQKTKGGQHAEQDTRGRR